MIKQLIFISITLLLMSCVKNESKDIVNGYSQPDIKISGMENNLPSKIFAGGDKSLRRIIDCQLKVACYIGGSNRPDCIKLNSSTMSIRQQKIVISMCGEGW